MFAHMKGEEVISPEQLNQAVHVVQQNYRGVYGEKKYRQAIGATVDLSSVWNLLWRVNPQVNNLPVVAIVTVYPDGTAVAHGPKLKYHPHVVK